MGRTPYRGEGISAPQAARLIEVPYATLDYWIRRGIAKPSVERAARGSGNTRAFNVRELVALRVVAELRRQGVSLQAIRRVLSFLRRHRKGEPLASSRLLAVGNTVQAVTEAEAVDVLRVPGQRVLALEQPLDDMERELSEQAQELRGERRAAG